MNRVVDSRHGKIIVNDHDVYVGRMLLEYGEFSEGEVDLFRQILKPDMIAVDVGANIGALTLPMAKMVKRVIAYEPQRELFHMLCGTCALNDLHNVLCVNAAVGEAHGEIPIYQVDTTQRNNLGSCSLLGMQDSAERVACVRLDFPFHFLKVDAEGMELEVLHGAADVIRQYQPCLYVENDRADKSDALIEFVESLGYAAHWHAPAFFNPKNHRGNAADLFKGMGSINMVCVPEGVRMIGFDRAKTGEWAQRWTIAPSWQEKAA